MLDRWRAGGRTADRVDGAVAAAILVEDAERRQGPRIWSEADLAALVEAVDMRLDALREAASDHAAAMAVIDMAQNVCDPDVHFFGASMPSPPCEVFWRSDPAVREAAWWRLYGACMAVKGRRRAQAGATPAQALALRMRNGLATAADRRELEALGEAGTELELEGRRRRAEDLDPPPGWFVAATAGLEPWEAAWEWHAMDDRGRDGCAVGQTAQGRVALRAWRAMRAAGDDPSASGCGLADRLDAAEGAASWLDAQDPDGPGHDGRLARLDALEGRPGLPPAREIVGWRTRA